MSASERLEAAILGNRDDVELYLVLADELQRQGDPRGELIVMQNLIDTIDARAERHAMARRCNQWIAAHDLLGPLRDFGASVFGRHAEVTWRYGFIRCLEIGWGETCADTPEQATETLAEILRHPSSPFITLLVLGPAPGDRGRMSMQCLIDALAETGRPKALRSLHLGKLVDWPLARTATGDIGRASPALPRLQKLTLEAGTVTIGALALPELTELRISCGNLDDQMIEDLSRMRCPKLARLKVSTQDAPPESARVVAHLRSHLKHVRTVSITRTPASY